METRHMKGKFPARQEEYVNNLEDSRRLRGRSCDETESIQLHRKPRGREYSQEKQHHRWTDTSDEEDRSHHKHKSSSKNSAARTTRDVSDTKKQSESVNKENRGTQKDRFQANQQRGSIGKGKKSRRGGDDNPSSDGSSDGDSRPSRRSDRRKKKASRGRDDDPSSGDDSDFSDDKSSKSS